MRHFDEYAIDISQKELNQFFNMNTYSHIESHNITIKFQSCMKSNVL